MPPRGALTTESRDLSIVSHQAIRGRLWRVTALGMCGVIGVTGVTGVILPSRVTGPALSYRALSPNLTPIPVSLPKSFSLLADFLWHHSFLH